MFANARVVLPPVPDVVSVPETAVDRTLYGDSVFIVAEDGKDARRQAEAQGGADLRRDRASVSTAGWRSCAASSAGDVVVGSGQLKLQNGVAGDRHRATASPPPAQPPVE